MLSVLVWASKVWCGRLVGEADAFVVLEHQVAVRKLAYWLKGQTRSMCVFQFLTLLADEQTCMVREAHQGHLQSSTLKGQSVLLSLADKGSQSASSQFTGHRERTLAFM